MAGDSHREVACVAPGFSPAFPSLWHSHFWLCSLLCGPATLGCAPLSAPGVHRDRVLAAPSPTRHLPSRMVLRDESVGLRRETASFPRFMRRNLSSLRARSAGLQPGISPFVAQPLLAVLRSSSSRLGQEAQDEVGGLPTSRSRCDVLCRAHQPGERLVRREEPSV